MAATAVGLALALLPLPLALGWVVGTAVLLVTIIRPLIGLALALLAGPLGAFEGLVLTDLGLSLGPLDSGQLLLLLTLAAWLANGLRRRRVMLPRVRLAPPLLLFIGVTALTLLDTFSLTYGLRELLKWLEMLLVIWLVADLVRDQGPPSRAQGARWLVAMLLLAGLSQALLGIWQFGLRGEGPGHFAVLGRFFRAYGTFQQPNPYGGYMNLTATLAWGTLLGLLMAAWTRVGPVGVTGRWAAAGRSLRNERGWFLFVAFCAMASSLALFFSWSRGAWLGGAAGLATLAFFLARRRWVGLIVLVAGASLVLVMWQLDVIPPSIVARLGSFTADFRLGDVRGVDITDANYAVLERLAHWQAAVDMARDHFWLGVGFGNYEPAYAGYALINWPYPLGHAHNYYLNLLAEIGFIGLVAYGLLWTIIIGYTLWLLRRLAWPERGIVLGLLAAWATLSVHHLVDKLYVNNIYVHLGVMLGLLHQLDSDHAD